MTNTKRWVDLLNQQHDLVLNSGGGLDFLLATRKFVAFLDTDPHARRYIKDLDYKWDMIYEKWYNNCYKMRIQLSELEQRIRAVCEKLEKAIEDLEKIPDAASRTDHISGRIREENWYQSSADMKDDFDLELLHVRRPSLTQTGHMISHVLSLAGVLADRAKVIGIEREDTTVLKAQAKELQRQYESAQRKFKHDWMSTGKHALEQLRIVVKIIDRNIFVDPANYKLLTSRFLAPPWIALMVKCAPPDLRRDAERLFKHTKTDDWDMELDFEPVIRLYLRRIFEELQFLASSRLVFQHLVEQYKVRCENYDWKHLTELIENHVKSVESKSEDAKKEARYEFEDLLTLHFARYLHDNGYTVHYTPRHGVHIPDLLGDLRNDLEPIVVEAKVVGQEFGTKQGKSWILEGLRALRAYLQNCYSSYGVTDGYLVVFRVGNEKSPMFTFDSAEWKIDQFTIVPKVINIGRINKKATPILIKKADFMEDLESHLN